MKGIALFKRGELDVLNGPLGKNILIFSASIAITGILQQLFNAADIAVVGQFVGKNAMAAVGSNSPIIGLIVNLFVGISLGTNVVISNLTGMKKFESIKSAVDTSLILALFCGVLSTIVGEIFAEPVLEMMSVPPEVFDMAVAYLRVYLLGLPVILLYNFEAAIFRSQGDSVTPLVALAISGVVNVLLNLFFVVVVGMTADGVALATVISNLVSAVILFWILTHSNTPVSIHRHKIKFDKEILKKLFIIGLPAGLQSAMFSISNIIIQSAINDLGTDVMAASSAAFNLEILIYYVTNAFAQACMTFTGQNNGAGNHKRCRSVLRISLLQDTIATLAISGVVFLLEVPLLSIFNSDASVIEYGVIRLSYILVGELLSVLIDIFSNAMRGYGRSMVPALITLFGVCGFRITWIFTFFAADKTFPNLMICYPLSWAIAAAALIISYLVMMRKMNKKRLKAA